MDIIKYMMEDFKGQCFQPEVCIYFGENEFRYYRVVHASFEEFVREFTLSFGGENIKRIIFLDAREMLGVPGLLFLVHHHYNSDIEDYCYFVK